MEIRHPVVLIVLVYATLRCSHPALAQFSQQGPKLVGTAAVKHAVHRDVSDASGPPSLMIGCAFAALVPALPSRAAAA